MMIECNYEITVATQPEPNAKYGRHFCRIELGNCLPEEARLRFNILNKKLSDEFTLTLREVTCYSKEIAGTCYKI